MSSFIGRSRSHHWSLGDKREEKEENMTKTEVEDIKHIETIKEQPKQEIEPEEMDFEEEDVMTSKTL